jgi:hypothetical protein
LGLVRISVFIRGDQLARLHQINDEQGVPLAVTIRKALDDALNPGTLTLSDAARLLEVPPETFMRWAHEDGSSMPRGVRVGALTLRYEREALLAWVERRRAGVGRTKKGAK